MAVVSLTGVAGWACKHVRCFPDFPGSDEESGQEVIDFIAELGDPEIENDDCTIAFVGNAGNEAKSEPMQDDAHVEQNAELEQDENMKNKNEEEYVPHLHRSPKSLGASKALA